jgi:hypothetical protein
MAALAALAVLVSGHQRSRSAEIPSAGVAEIEVKGTAVDKGARGISGIQVSVIRDGRVVSECVTKDDGTYQVSLPVGDPLNVRFLKQPDYDPAVIFQLSGRHNQDVAQVIYKQGEPRSTEAELATALTKAYLEKLSDNKKPKPSVQEIRPRVE